MSHILNTQNSGKSKISFKSKGSEKSNVSLTSTNFTKNKKKDYSSKLIENLDDLIFEIGKSDIEIISIKIERLYNFLQSHIVNNSNIDGIEYINNDEETLCIERFLNQCSLGLINIKDFGVLIFQSVASLSFLYNCKWSYMCFSFIIDCFKHVNKNQSILFEKIILDKIKQFLKSNILLNNPFLIHALQLLITDECNEICEFIYSKINEEFLNGEINIKMLLTGISKLEQQIQEIDVVKNCSYTISSLNVLPYLHKIYGNKKIVNSFILKKIIKEAHISLIINLFFEVLQFFEKDSDYYKFSLYHELFKIIIEIVLLFMENACFLKNLSNSEKIKNELNKKNLDNSIKIYLFLDKGIHQLKFKDNYSQNEKNLREIIHKHIKIINLHIVNQEHLLIKNNKILSKSEIDFKRNENENFSLFIKFYMNVICFNSSNNHLNKVNSNLNDLMDLLNNISKINEGIKEIPFLIDCFLFESYYYCINYCYKYYKLIFIDEKAFFNENIFFEFVNSTKNSVILSLKLITQKSDHFSSMVKYSEVYNIHEIISNTSNKLLFETLTNEFIIKLILSVMEIIITISSNKFQESNERVNNIYDIINSKLDENERDSILIKCICISSDKIKIKILETFLFIDRKQLSTVEISGLLDTISKFNWFDLGLEDILGKLLIMIMKKFDDCFKEDDNLPFENRGFIVLLLNLLERGLINKSNLDQSSEIIIVISFACLINLSTYPSFQKAFECDSLKPLFTNIINLMNSPIDNIKDYVPIHIEYCIYFWNIDVINNIIAKCEITPYSYLGIRLINHISTILTNTEVEGISEIYNDTLSSIDLIQKVNNILKRTEMYNIKSIINEFEISSRIDRKTIDVLNNVDLNNELSCINFVNLYDEEFIFKQRNLMIKNVSFYINWLYGDISFGKINIKDSYETKFDPSILCLKTKNLTLKVDDLSIQEQIDNQINTNIDISSRKINDFTEFTMKLLKNEKDSDSSINKDLQINRKDLVYFTKYASDIDLFKKNHSEENVDNPYIRSLALSAFLKSIFVIANISSDEDVDKIKVPLRQPDLFLKLCLMLESTDFKYCNLASKTLTFLTFILDKISKNLNDEKAMEYEKLISIFSVIISKIYTYIVLNRNNIEEKLYNILLLKFTLCLIKFTEEMKFLNFDKSTRNIIISRVLSHNLMEFILSYCMNILEKESDYDFIYSFKKNQKVKKMKNGRLTKPKVPPIYNQINLKIPVLISIYMDICKQNAFKILELINKYKYLNGVKLRSSIISDILYSYKILTFKKRSDLSRQKIIVMFPVSFKCLKTGFCSNLLAIITDKQLLFTKYDEKNYISNGFENDIVNLVPLEKYTFMLNEITTIIKVQLGNRIFLKSNFFYALFFYKVTQAVDFVSNLSSKVQNLSILETDYKFYIKYSDISDKNNIDNKSKLNKTINNFQVRKIDNKNNNNLSVLTEQSVNIQTMPNKNPMNYSIMIKSNKQLNNSIVVDKNLNKSIISNRNNNLNNSVIHNSIIENEENLENENPINAELKGSMISQFESNIFIISFEMKSFLDFKVFNSSSDKLIPNFKIALLSNKNYKEINESLTNKIKNEVENGSNTSNENLFILLFDEDLKKLTNDDLEKQVKDGFSANLCNSYLFHAEYNLLNAIEILFDDINSVIITFQQGINIKLTFHGDMGYYNFHLLVSMYIKRLYNI